MAKIGEILGDIYLKTQKHLQILGDINVPSLKSFGGHTVILGKRESKPTFLSARENPVSHLIQSPYCAVHQYSEYSKHMYTCFQLCLHASKFIMHAAFASKFIRHFSKKIKVE